MVRAFDQRERIVSDSKARKNRIESVLKERELMQNLRLINWLSRAWMTHRLLIGGGLLLIGMAVSGHAKPAESDAIFERARPCAQSKGGCPPLKWVTLPAGSFEMGSSQGDVDERPMHQVHVRAFKLAATEVTVGQYRACVEAGVCTAPARHADNWSKKYCNWGQRGRALHPMNCVNWAQARTFSRWVGGDLPTEAQWEYAARSAGQRVTYPWGAEETTCARAIMSDGGGGCGKERTWRVCSRPQGYTVQTLCDMAGSVWEWTLDEYQSSYQGAPTNGEQYVGSVPTCKHRCAPDSSARRVYRGGGWRSGPRDLRVTNRYSGPAHYQFNNVGFRPRLNIAPR